MWKEKLQEIIKEKEIYGEKVNIGATEREIQLLNNETKKELNVDLPSEYVNILKVVNGIEFNGFILYGIDERLLEKKHNQPINGLIEYNKIWHENEWQKQFFFLGESNISWYAYDFITSKYCELDNPSGREIQIFSNLECMVEKAMHWHRMMFSIIS